MLINIYVVNQALLDSTLTIYEDRTNKELDTDQEIPDYRRLTNEFQKTIVT